MEFYLIKYRVTTANVISNAIETYLSEEDADAKYYENLADAISNNKLKYVMLSIIDSDGNDIKHTSITSPGEVPITEKYCLIEYTSKVDGTVLDTFSIYDDLDSAKNKMVEDQTLAKNDETINSLTSIILNTTGIIELTEIINGGGHLDYGAKYLAFVNKTKNDSTLNPSITRYDTLEAAKTSVYRLISNSINDTTLFYIDCRIMSSTGETILHERKSCKGRIPVENENE